mmetsp:Transcript_12391/g.29708  ORF Transcript_12391/g.29708 Transcript_12391/m.29708 type:complete len:213 (+) Transcript_12391:242-880(+)
MWYVPSSTYAPFAADSCAVSSSESARRAAAGLPPKTWPAGTLVPGSTVAPGATYAPFPTTTLSPRVAPAPTTASSSTVAPLITAPAPMTTLLPILTAPLPVVSIARSLMMLSEPTEMLAWSPFITAPYHTLLFLPTSTVPMMLAEGAMKQESAITGFLSATAITSRCRFNVSLVKLSAIPAPIFSKTEPTPRHSAPSGAMRTDISLAVGCCC